MCHYDLDCHPIFMSFKKKRLSKIQALPIWKGENPPWNTFKSNITALGAICCVSELFFFVCVYFRGYPAKRKWDVRIFPAQPQHSLTAEHNSAIWKISTANIKFWSQSLRYESNGVFFGFFFGIVILQKGGYSSSKLLLLLPPHWNPQPEEGYARQAEGKWTNQRGKKKWLSPGNANPQFFRLCLLSSGEAE